MFGQVKVSFKICNIFCVYSSVRVHSWKIACFLMQVLLSNYYTDKQDGGNLVAWQTHELHHRKDSRSPIGAFHTEKQENIKNRYHVRLLTHVKNFLHEYNRHLAIMKNNVKNFRLWMEHTVMEEADLPESLLTTQDNMRCMNHSENTEFPKL
jgi:hypothetical protein